jgi:hypothetical protein
MVMVFAIVSITHVGTFGGDQRELVVFRPGARIGAYRQRLAVLADARERRSAARCGR